MLFPNKDQSSNTQGFSNTGKRSYLWEKYCKLYPSHVTSFGKEIIFFISKRETLKIIYLTSVALSDVSSWRDLQVGCCQMCHLFKKFYLFIYLFIYLFMAVLGLRCCVQAFSSCSERGLPFTAVHGLLIAVASLVAEHGL